MRFTFIQNSSTFFLNPFTFFTFFSADIWVSNCCGAVQMRPCFRGTFGFIRNWWNVGGESIVEMTGPCLSRARHHVRLLCCRLMLMGCSPGLACDVWCELPGRYHWARPFGLSKGRGGLAGFCANNSWVYMVGSVQNDTICFPISPPAIEYKAHYQRQRASSTSGNCAMIKT